MRSPKPRASLAPLALHEVCAIVLLGPELVMCLACEPQVLDGRLGASRKRGVVHSRTPLGRITSYRVSLERDHFTSRSRNEGMLQSPGEVLRCLLARYSGRRS